MNTFFFFFFTMSMSLHCARVSRTWARARGRREFDSQNLKLDTLSNVTEKQAMA